MRDDVADPNDLILGLPLTSSPSAVSARMQLDLVLREYFRWRCLGAILGISSFSPQAGPICRRAELLEVSLDRHCAHLLVFVLPWQHCFLVLGRSWRLALRADSILVTGVP